MHKKLIAISVAVLMLVAVGCRSNGKEVGETEMSEQITETFHEVGNVSVDNDFKESDFESALDKKVDIQKIETEIVESSESKEISETGESESSKNTNKESASETTTGSEGMKPSEQSPPTIDKELGKENETKPSAGNVSTETIIHEANASGYEAYNAMTGEKQRAFMESFDSVEAFFDWYNTAKEKYDAQHPDVEISDDTINIDKIISAEK